MNHLDDAGYDFLKEIVGEGCISKSGVDRLSYSRDLYPLVQIWMLSDEAPPPPDLVLWPRSTREVSEILRFANSGRIPVTPYGAGSGVCGGAMPLSGGIVLDLKKMESIRSLDEDSLTINAESGIVGEHLERWLNDRGYTLGHFPSSIYCSTLGGWLASRSAGQLSTKYGKIEDMVLNVEVVLPDGGVLTTKTATPSGYGPDFNQLFVGSEGTLGVIAAATLRIHPYPEERIFRGFNFKGLNQGLNAIKEILQSGITPAAVRLYDKLDTFIIGSGKGDKSMSKSFENFALSNPWIINKAANLIPFSCLLILTFEGVEGIIEEEDMVAKEICNKFGGKDLGEEPARRWWKERYSVSYKQSRVYEIGGIADTIEVATTWDRLNDLYIAVRRAISRYAIVLAHFSHAYQEGCSIYFTFSAHKADKLKREKLYGNVWEAAMNATLKAGGTISHHHGIGLLKARWMDKEHGAAMGIYRAAKRVLDPNNIMNPGKMGL